MYRRWHVEGSLVADSARWGLSRRSGGFVPACAWSARRRGTCFTSRAKRNVRACTSAQALSDCFGAQTLEAEDCSGSRLRVRAVEKRSLARCHATWRTLRLQRLAEPTFEPAPVAEPNDCLVPGSVTPPRGGHRPQPLQSSRWSRRRTRPQSVGSSHSIRAARRTATAACSTSERSPRMSASAGHSGHPASRPRAGPSGRSNAQSDRAVPPLTARRANAETRGRRPIRRCRP